MKKPIKLRLSITDRCNFRCFYCYAKDFVPLKKEEMLSYEDFLFLIETLTFSGIEKVKITGGEPLYKRDIEIFIKRLSEIEGLKDISLTTNGFYLEEKAEMLRGAGLRRINVSIDSLKKDTVKKISGVDAIEKIIDGIEVAVKKFSTIKINVVLLKGINTDEIFDFIEFSCKYNIFLRFIELMPAENTIVWERFFYPEELLIDEIKKRGKVEYMRNCSHEFFYNFEGIRFSVIPSYSRFFCNSCDKVRIDCAGNLKLCLFDKRNYPLIDIIKNRKREELISKFSEIIENKKSYKGKESIFEMVRIGG